MYLDWLKEIVPLDLHGYKIALDVANGSATTTAYKLLTAMGAECKLMHSEPNGVNINTACGSTHPESLIDVMENGDYDIGLAFDGDADRLIAIAPDGQQINGDKVLYCCGKYLKEKNENVQVIAVEPAGSPVLSEGKAGAHKIQGIGAGFIPDTLDTTIYDEVVTITDEDAYKEARRFGICEGILVGISSGAALKAASVIAKRPENAGKKIVVILPDSGDRYLSTELFVD